MSLRSNIRETANNGERLENQAHRLYELVSRLGGHFPLGRNEGSTVDVPEPQADSLLTEHMLANGRQSQTMDKLEQIIQQLSGYLEPPKDEGLTKIADIRSTASAGRSW